MSVLLIGLNSDTRTYGFRRRKARDTKWNKAHLKRQEDYRKELDFQVQQKRLRRSREKQIEKWTDIKLEAMYNRELWRLKHQEQDYHERHEGEPAQEYRKFQSLGNKFEDNLSGSFDRGHRESVKLPAINNYSTTYLDSYGVTNELTNQQRPLFQSSHKGYETPPRHDRAKTEVSVNDHRSNRLQTQSKANHYELPQDYNPEVSLNRLRRYQDKKINEVYEMLTDSVQILNQPASVMPQWPSYSQKKPHRKYKSSHEQQGNPNIDSQYYRLPSKSRHIQLQDHGNNQQEREWRVWYAKQKLEELHSYLKKEKIQDELQEKFLGQGRPLYTLGFNPEKW